MPTSINYSAYYGRHICDIVYDFTTVRGDVAEDYAQVQLRSALMESSQFLELSEGQLVEILCAPGAELTGGPFTPADAAHRIAEAAIARPDAVFSIRRVCTQKRRARDKPVG